MERTFANKGLLSNLGTLIKNNRIKLISQEKHDDISTTDEALDHAKTYWMLGWNWNDISDILDQLGFDKEDIDHAIDKTQSYAEETTKDGSFSVFVIGQLIKLTNGKIGQLLEKYPNQIKVRLYEDNEVILATEQYVDKEASMQLKAAFLLRASSIELLKTAEPENLVNEESQIKEPEAEIKKIEEPKTKVKKTKEPKTEVKKTEDYKVEKSTTPTLSTPKKQNEEKWTWPPAEELHKVDIADKKTSKLMSAIKSTQLHINEVQEKIRTEHSKAIDIYEKHVSELKEDELKSKKLLEDLHKQAYAVTGLEEDALAIANESLNEILSKVVHIDGLVLQARRFLESSVRSPSDSKQFEFLLGAINAIITSTEDQKIYKLLTDLLKQVSEFVKGNTIIDEEYKRQVALRDFSREDYAKKSNVINSDDNIFKKFKNMVLSFVDKIKGSHSAIVNRIVPQLTAIDENLDSFINKFSGFDKKNNLNKIRNLVAKIKR
jgi:hypothetical protein